MAFQVPRSDLHCICVRIDTESPAGDDATPSSSWSIFCFECDEELYIDSYKKLREAVNIVKSMAGKKPAGTTTSKSSVATSSGAGQPLKNSTSSANKVAGGQCYNRYEFIRNKTMHGCLTC